MLFKTQLLALVIVALSLGRVAALPASASFSSLDEESRPILQTNKDGQLDSDLTDDEGNPLINPTIVLDSRGKSSFDYSQQKVRGVNLGGWLVAEPWITPSLFDATGDDRVIDEYTYGQYVSNAASKLQKHWNTFITEDDFAQIASAGLNHVRIPIGYWAFDTSEGEPYVHSNQFDLLTQAVRWAAKYNIKVLVDLHGAPGSQNGYDNSGRKGALAWPNDPNNAVRAKKVIEKIAAKYATDEFSGTVTMIELLNEPAGYVSQNVLSYTRQYYVDGYYALREQNTQAAVTISDMFQNYTYWEGLMQPPEYENVILDRHIYSVFSPAENALSKKQRLGYFCDQTQPLESSQKNLLTIVGEWTSAPTDCAKYLNGRGIGARYDGSYGQDSYYIGSCTGKTGTGENFTNSYKNYLRDMFETQTSVYENASGWIYWTWKTEAAADWDYKRGLAGGWITYNLDSKPNAAC